MLNFGKLFLNIGTTFNQILFIQNKVLACAKMGIWLLMHGRQKRQKSVRPPSP
jgi:hypothetical protein